MPKCLNQLETERLLLRRWREEDLDAFAAMNADPRVMEHFPATLSREESRALMARIESIFERHGFGAWACERKDSGEFIGFTGLSVPSFEAHFMPCVEIAWRIAHAQWGHGFAPEAARAALDAAFGPLALPEVLSFTAVVNTRSRRVMEKIGMRHDPAGDFDHPALPEGHPLRRHVLYRITPQ